VGVESVEDFLSKVEDSARRADAIAICALMREVTGAEPVLWPRGIVGFGRFHYRGASGGEGDWLAVGLAPRKQNLTIYLGHGVPPRATANLGKHSTGKGCIYIKRLSDVDTSVLGELIGSTFRELDGTTVTPR
jgi:hypothetical protein